MKSYFKHYDNMMVLLDALNDKQGEMKKEQQDFIRQFSEDGYNIISYDTFSDLATKLSSQGVLSRLNTEISDIIKQQQYNDYLIFTDEVVGFLKRYLKGLYDRYELFGQNRKISQLITKANSDELFLYFLVEALIYEIGSRYPVTNFDFNQFVIQYDKDFKSLRDLLITSSNDIITKLSSLGEKIDEKCSLIDEMLKDSKDPIKTREAQTSCKLEQN